MNKYLFLDIDGVLNSDRTVFAHGKLVHANLIKFRIANDEPLNTMFDPISIGLLKYAQEKIGFKIVISSTWRHLLSLDNFFQIFLDYGWNTDGIIIGKTGDESVIRGQQIKNWLNNHAKPDYKYCILDDSCDMLPDQFEKLVNTTMEDGFMWKHFLKIFDVFGEPFTEKDTLLTF